MVKRFAIVALCAFVVGGCVTPPPPGSHARYWEKFPEPPGRSQGVSWIGEDRRGGVWIMSGQATYSWKSSEKTWSKPLLRAGQYLTQLYGGAKTGLYATQPGKEDHWGEVFSLEEGQPRYVTRFYYDVRHNPAGFHVAGKDRFLNWGGGKLRIFADEEWIEHPADIPQTGTLLFDVGDTLTLYANGKLYIVDRRNEVFVTEADGGVSRKATKGTLWGPNRAMVLEYGAPGVTGFDIRTGHLADTMKINEALGGRPVYDLFSTQDGSVWIMAYDQAFAGYVLFRVPPDGAVSLLRDTAGIPWDNHQFTQAPRSVLMDRHGVVWFSSPSVGIFYLKDGVVRQFDQRVENSPAASGMLYEDRNGVIYAADTTGLYAYNNGASLTGAAPATPIPIATPGAPVWRCGSEEGNRLYRAWQAGGLVMYVSRGGSALTAVKPEDGQARFSIALSRDDAEQTWVTTGSKTGELTVCLKDRILTVDAGTGVILRTLKCKRDHRIAPIAVSDSYILADRYRGSSISRVQPTGDAAWTSGLPGYVMTHPTAFGPYLLCQTRQGSYGGQATCGVDSNTGETLWNDVVNAYGAGTAFADDATYCVETDTFLAPDTTEAWVIARHPATGRRLWHYRRSGTTVGQAPLMDRVTDRVYVALDNGTIVCLDGLTGDPVWEKVLPQPPAKAPAASYEPYTSCMSLSANVLTVVTADQLLYLLHAGDGEVLHRIVVTEDIIRHGKRTGSPKLIAGPWIVGTLLVVPTENGMVAYILNGLRK